jgi:hypothetical protein
MFENASRVGMTRGAESGAQLVNMAVNIHKMNCRSYSFATFVFPSRLFYTSQSSLRNTRWETLSSKIDLSGLQWTGYVTQLVRKVSMEFCSFERNR